ncbi:DUF1761 domain-containing protein [Metabacillus sp. KIGAM252]|uniref:DUF1761 domain-containing protein n=1 Tax=Metabacillus flavus TaxID=2823519 RepID=A0ABS5LBW7_9BACI|nr:DUF1761 domain-containing protein [Metabacillus flavus]MBS2968106.1 DUF1761 domain-containing protein [Metabacillus flavus]
MLINVSDLNFLAILAGGILYMIYGGIYYSILLKDKGNFAQNESKGPLKYIFSVIVAFISSFLTAILIQSMGAENWLTGAGIGLIIGVLISIVYVKNSLFGLMSRKAMLIAIGDHLVIFTLLGVLHGLLN